MSAGQLPRGWVLSTGQITPTLAVVLAAPATPGVVHVLTHLSVVANNAAAATGYVQVYVGTATIANVLLCAAYMDLAAASHFSPGADSWDGQFAGGMGEALNITAGPAGSSLSAVIIAQGYDI